MPTSKHLIGKKCKLEWSTKTLTVTVVGLDNAYPATAYQVKWTKEDNPDEDIPDDCAGCQSVAHYSHLTRIEDEPIFTL